METEAAEAAAAHDQANQEDREARVGSTGASGCRDLSLSQPELYGGAGTREIDMGPCCNAFGPAYGRAGRTGEPSAGVRNLQLGAGGWVQAAVGRIAAGDA